MARFHPSESRGLHLRFLVLALLSTPAFWGCTVNDAAPPDNAADKLDGVAGDGAESFLSHVSGLSSSGRGGLESATLDGTGGTQNAGLLAADDANKSASTTPERAIAEADIIQMDGDRLYALSRYAGLSVIDVSKSGALRLLGRNKARGNPFEMYLKNGVAYVMYNDHETYEFDDAEGIWGWRSSSEVEALDVSDPAQITSLGSREIPGSISDSRMVGDVIYVVTYENGWCWRCDEKPNTRVVSFDAGDPSHFETLDELRFEDGEESGYQRSIAVTTERIYIGGPTWDDRDSSVQIVDISDPMGALGLGAEVPILGSIESRWQMDEFEGILRIISQPRPWRSDDPPYVQTFRVESSTAVTPLATLAIKLPRPEDLRSVRFDGDQAYAVTFEQVDPLFTFDLSDPENPKQVGELEIPGFVYHMEPRGDRVYGLGFDRDDEAGGSLHVSIFDVSDLSKPTMTSRVNFGGDWASLAEDQDRIHKAFNILLDAGLILVPFSGGSWEEDTCNYTYQSGIQLIDVNGDTLAKRGVAPQVGDARRSLLHGDALIGVTDNAVQAFDISDRDKPTELDRLEVARNISQVVVMGDSLMRFGTDWWTDRAMLDFTPFDQADTAEPLGEIDLASVVEQDTDRCSGESHWDGQTYVHGNTAYVPRRSYGENRATGQWKESLVFHIVDLSQRDNPRIVGKFAAEPAADNGYVGGVVLTDSALLIGRGEGHYSYDSESGERNEPTYAYDIYDLAKPHSPRLTTRFEVPSQVASGGWGRGVMACGMDMAWGGWWFPGNGATGALVAGDLVVSQHEVAADDDTGRVRYFLDRLDVSDPDAPKLLAPINIPGQVVHIDRQATRLVTIDEVLEEHSAKDWQDCYTRSSRARFVEDDGVCRTYKRRANSLVLNGDSARRVSQQMLDEGGRASGFVAVSDDRLFWMSYVYDRNGAAKPEVRLETLAYQSEGKFARLDAVKMNSIGGVWSQVYARGARAFVSRSGGIEVVDTSALEQPKLSSHDLPGWGCNALEVHGDRAYCALGQYGVVSLDL